MSIAAGWETPQQLRLLIRQQEIEIEALRKALAESCDEERARCRAEGGYPCELQAEITLLKERMEKLWRFLRTSHRQNTNSLKRYPPVPTEWNDWFTKRGEPK